MTSSPENTLSVGNEASSIEKGRIENEILKKKSHSANLVWKGTERDTECEKFKRYVEKMYKTHFESDREFHKWSVDKFQDFWGAAWKYFDIIVSEPYKEVFVKTGPGFLDNDWFTGATFNYAENLMRIRDETVALMCEDEDGNTDTVTYASMFEEVKLYAAAFRRQGLMKSDVVACYMSNRKEAIFAMLATLSIGAVWGGAIPYLGAQAASNIISRMEPKFLIAVDRHQDYGKEYDFLCNLPMIVENTPTLEKVIIVPTKGTVSPKKISHIKNCCFLRDFLENEKLKNETVPDLVFEQLPSSHPVFLSFTSGTTGISKGPVHSAQVLVQSLTNVAFTNDLGRGDVLFCATPMGWIPLLNFVGAFSFGVTIYLYCGNICFVKNCRSIWDILSDCKASFLMLLPSEADAMEKSKLIPRSSLNFECLKVIVLTSCPIKMQNIEQLYKYVSKRTFIGSRYASTETFTTGSGNYLKSPSYAGEIQLPALGIDIRCFNEEGVSVIGELGTLVFATPAPCFPSCLWKDRDNQIMTLNYLSQFPGVWCQSDICWINPETLGIIIKGRSDDTFIQNGLRFGAEDIYFAIHDMEEIDDYICVAQNRSDGDHRVVLFVKLKECYEFTSSLRSKIEHKIESELYGYCVPRVIMEIKDIPYSVNNKRMEGVVKKMLATNKIPDTFSGKNPECLKYYCNIPEIMNYYTASKDDQ